LALAILSDRRADKILETGDAILQYMVSRYRQDPDNRDNTVTVEEITAATGRQDEEVREALRYLVETPAITARTTDFPDPPESCAFAIETSLTYHSMDPLLEQLAEWSGLSAAMPAFQIDNADQTASQFDRIVSKFKNHPVLAWFFVVAFGIVLLRGVVAAARDLFSWISAWIAS